MFETILFVMRTMVAALLLSLATLTATAQINQALFTDPRPDDKVPAQNVEMAVPSHGEKLLGVMLLAVGERPHPTAVLLHGFPGYEQNLDLAQALRRSGWNVLAVHYRGSWGTGGVFSFVHCMEDANAMVDFVLDADNVKKYRIDTKKIAVIGHSMGGFMAVQAFADKPQVTHAVILSEANPATDLAIYNIQPPDLLPLSGTSVDALKNEATAHANDWSYSAVAAKITPRPVLILSAEDGLQKSNEALEEALKKAGDTRVQNLHMKTDHAFASRRVAMISTVVDWLARN